MANVLVAAVVAMLLVAIAAAALRPASVRSRAHAFAPGASVVDLTSWQLHSTADPATVYNVQVPNTIVGALLEAGYIDFDPFYGDNLARINKTQFAVPWVYRTTFELPASISGLRFVLGIDGLTYNGTIDVNGAQVADQATVVGSFQRYRFDVTPFVTPGSNTLTIRVFRSPHDPNEVRGKTGLELSFYDWTAHPPDLSMGLWRPVFITALNASAPLTFDGVSVKTTVSNELSNNNAYINISFVVTNWAPSTITVSNVYVAVSGAGLVTPIVASQPVLVLGPYQERRVHFSWRETSALIVANPPLWNPWQIGAPRLLKLEAGINGNVPFITTRIGLRSVDTRLTRSGALQFVINNVPLQIRGAAWCPDLFLRSDATRLRQQLAMVRDMGLNAIRLEGKVEYEPFFDIADDLGLLVLADLGCCETFPAWTEVEYAAAAAAMTAQVRRLESHASMGWFLASSDALPPTRIEATYNAIFAREAWPNAIASSASQQSSPLTGQTGLKMTGPYSWSAPSIYWLQDGASSDGIFGGAWGFFTEGGPGEAPMTYNSWTRTVPTADQWGPQGALGPAWDAHMGNPNGAFPSLQYFVPPLNARYGTSLGAGDFLYRAQVATYEGMRGMFEGYSRHKHRNATGVIQWMLNNAQPQHLWHLFDNYLVAGGGYYGAKKACAPLVATLSPLDGTVVLLNSQFLDVQQQVRVDAEIWTLDGELVWSAQQQLPAVPANAALKLDVAVPLNLTRFGPQDTFFVVLTTTATGSAAVDNWYWVSPTADILDFAASNGFRTPCSQWANFTALNTLQNPNLLVQVTIDEAAQLGTVAVSNPSTVVAFFIGLHLVNATSGFDYTPQLWTDNYFSLRPGANVTVTVDLSLSSQPVTVSGSILYYQTYSTSAGDSEQRATLRRA